MNKQVSYAYQHLSRTETLFKGENKNINISVSKNSPVNASLSLDGYKHSMVQIIALTRDCREMLIFAQRIDC